MVTGKEGQLPTTIFLCLSQKIVSFYCYYPYNTFFLCIKIYKLIFIFIGPLLLFSLHNNFLLHFSSKKAGFYIFIATFPNREYVNCPKGAVHKKICNWKRSRTTKKKRKFFLALLFSIIFSFSTFSSFLE